MTPLLFVAAAAAGAAGRHLAAHLICGWQAVLFANTAGSALLGWLVSNDVSPQTLTVVGVGFSGALTTFSSFALESRALGWKYGSLYAVTTLVCVTGAASVATTL